MNHFVVKCLFRFFGCGSAALCFFVVKNFFVFESTKAEAMLQGRRPR